MKIRIHGGRVIDPANNIDAVLDVTIEDGHILAVGAIPDGFVADQEIDASGQIVCPGLVDLQARLREPGQEHKGTIKSETAAAAAGGVTSLCCPPDTHPVIDTSAVANLIQERAELAGKARVFPKGALTPGLNGEKICEMRALRKAGCVGFSNGDKSIPNTLVLRRAMEYAATYNYTIFLHPEDPWLADGGCAHEGAISTRLGLAGIPEYAETVEVARLLMLIEQTGVRAHFGQLSTARALQMIGRAQHDGLPITCDVAVHHLHLTEMDIGNFQSQCHVLPPLRTQRDRDGLRDGLTRNVVAAICSDHQPHDLDAKLAPFAETEPGISSLETLLPLSLKLVDEGTMTLPEVITKLTSQPAQILGIPAGTLSPDARADICIFDPEHYWRVTSEALLSRGHNTPFLNWELKGRVTHTLLDGMLVHRLTET